MLSDNDLAFAIIEMAERSMTLHPSIRHVLEYHGEPAIAVMDVLSVTRTAGVFIDPDLIEEAVRRWPNDMGSGLVGEWTEYAQELRAKVATT